MLFYIINELKEGKLDIIRFFSIKYLLIDFPLQEEEEREGGRAAKKNSDLQDFLNCFI